MSVNEAIARLETMQRQIIGGGTNVFGDIAAMLREANELIESIANGRCDDEENIQRAERWLKQ